MNAGKDYLPVTEAAATENKIANSVKISKQLMKAQLTAKIKELTENILGYSQEHEALITKFKNEAELTIREQILLSMHNDSEFSRFRNFFNKFSTHTKETSSEYAKSNVELIRDIFTYASISKMLNKDKFGEKELLTFNKDQLLDVNVDLMIYDYEAEDYLSYSQQVHINDDLIVQLVDIEASRNILKAQSKILNELTEKLDNIDAVAEQMEAQLLVQELSKTEDGKEALKIAGNLVGDMLGETPALLDIK